MSDPERLAALIGRIGRGRHGSRDLTRAEAADALRALFAPEADPLQLGAFLIAQRMKGETAEELAGFVDAARATIEGCGTVRHPEAVDLPCYAGKRRAPPLHLLAALRAARSDGIPVVIHAPEAIAGRLSAVAALRALGIDPAGSLAEADAMLRTRGIALLSLDRFCPPLARLLGLRPRLGVRSFANTVARLLNPLGCGGQLNGFFHAPYGARMAAANRLLGQPRALLFMGAEGEPELYADRQKLLLWLRGEQPEQPLPCPDAGCPPYPRAAATPDALRHRLQQLHDGAAPDAREAAVLARMARAFALAAGVGGWG
ncbi:MAG: anthranilate phosphoribosyltransferase [Zetaproteobacteria bacterium]|nr:MAG: anthranilate phosphoribosyltransferase [Zetaproteobacteria bacterium]